MSIPAGVNNPYSQSNTAEAVPRRSWTLSALSDSVGIIDPDSGNEVTVRKIKVNVAGTLALVDSAGNVTTPVMLAGQEISCFYNGVKSTGTVTITASDITVFE